MPATQSAANYVLLAAHLLALPSARPDSARATARFTQLSSQDPSGGHSTREGEYVLLGVWRLRAPWWLYLLLAVADVEGNYFLVKAYQYTTITSVQLLDCFTIPCVMVRAPLAHRQPQPPTHTDSIVGGTWPPLHQEAHCRGAGVCGRAGGAGGVGPGGSPQLLGINLGIFQR